MEENTFIDLFVFQQLKVKDIEKSLGINAKERKNLEIEFADEIKIIRSIRSKYYSRKKCFKDFKDFYYNWYVIQKQECKYCQISQTDLHKLFPNIMPIKSEEDKLSNNYYKRKYGTLEIEKIDSLKPYCPDNMVLACPLCNNAKSNLIDVDSWKTIFVNSIKEYYKKCLYEVDNG